MELMLGLTEGSLLDELSRAFDDNVMWIQV